MYSFPYVLILLFFGLCAFSYEYTQDVDRRRRISITAGVVFLIFFGFRGYVYTDWIAYTELFRNVEWSDVVSFDLSDKRVREPGFLILCLLCKNIFHEYVFLNLVCVTIYFLLLTRCCKQFEIRNISLILTLFMAMDGATMTLNMLRNTISIGIWLNSLVYIKERKPIPYFSLCFLAFTFHLSSILFFPLYFVLHRKTNKWVFLGLFSFFFFFYISKASIVLSVVQLLGLEGALGAKAKAYTELFTAARALNPTGTLERISMVALLFIYYDEIAEKYKNRYIVINCLLMYFGMYYLLGEFKTVSERMALLFVFARWFIWVDLINILIIENNKRLLASILFLYCLYMTSLNMNQPILEYDNMLFGAKTEAQRRQVFFKIVGDKE